MNHVLSCPLDQLYIGGYLACDVTDAHLKEKLSDIRYITAKRLKACNVREFNSVSDKFYLQKDLVYQVVKGPKLPPHLEKWIPAFYDSLDSAAIYWGIKCDEEDGPWGDGTVRDSVGVESRPQSVPVESHGVHSRGTVHENA